VSLPPNFSQAVDLSSLGKPPVDTSTPMPGFEVTAENLQNEVLPLSNSKPVVILCWSAQVITKILTLASQQGIGEEPLEPTEPEEDEALAALDQGDYATAEAAYKKLLARKPNDNFAKLGLSQVQLLIRTEGLDGQKVMEDAVKRPDDIATQLQCADVEVMSGYLEPAFERLLHLVVLHDGEERKLVKDRLLELFGLVDPADPRVIKARASLANALF